jgi:2-oxoglutarate dehydrogenase E1 component
MQDSLMQQMLKSGHLSGSNAAYVEELYERFLVEEESIPLEWRKVFKSLRSSNGKSDVDVSHAGIRRDFELLGRESRYKQVLSNDAIVNSEHESKQVKVLQLISSYRVRGHQKSNLDPLGIMRRDRVPDLELEFHDLFPIDFSTIFQTGSLFISKEKAALREIVDILERIYCDAIGYEFMHIVNLAEKQWIQQRIESNDGNPVINTTLKSICLSG